MSLSAPAVRKPQTLAQRLTNSARALHHYHAKKAARLRANPDFDPALTKPVHFVGAPAVLPAAERAAKERELACLRREAAATARGIDHLEKQLAA